MIHKEKVIGLLQVANKVTDYDENDIQLFDTIGKAIAPVLNARLQEEIQKRKREQTQKKLKEQVEELQRWHNATLGRENRILDLKREVNELLGKAGQPPCYPSAKSQDKKE